LIPLADAVPMIMKEKEACPEWCGAIG